MRIRAHSPQFFYDTEGLVAFVRAAQNIGQQRMHPTLDADCRDRATRERGI
jgi:hypothetical protein